MTTLKITPNGETTTDVSVDGTDIGDGLRRCTVMFDPSRPPTVHLDIAVIVEPFELDNPRVIVPPQTQKALEALGWKSPEEAKLLEVVHRTMVAEEIEAAHAKDPTCPDCCLPTAAAIARTEPAR